MCDLSSTPHFAEQKDPFIPSFPLGNMINCVRTILERAAFFWHHQASLIERRKNTNEVKELCSHGGARNVDRLVSAAAQNPSPSPEVLCRSLDPPSMVPITGDDASGTSGSPV
ncbi:hypothetical protein NL676_031158 [Syzygium grande]|nr:hypothetical protein NL676_031158 [Syzygium grande]